MTLPATERLYYNDSFAREFDAEILLCEPFSGEAGSKSPAMVWKVVLNRTFFYPASGGQPNDLGRLGEANVLDVRDEEETIVHVVDKPLQPGPAHGRINWDRRFDHMQQHTGQHLLSAIFLERHGLPTVSFHLGDEVSTIDLRGPEPSQEMVEAVEHAANQAIFDDLPVSIRYGTAQELAQLGARKQVDRSGTLRAIEIEGIDLQPCGGTHLKRTGQIGLLLTRRCSKIRQDWRVEFVCGQRAERVARSDFQLVRGLAGQFECASTDLVSAAGRVLSEREAQRKALQTLTLRLAETEAITALASTSSDSSGVRLVSRVVSGVEPEYLLPFATEVARVEKTTALLVHADSGHLVFAQHPSMGNDMNVVLQRVLEKLGGKGGGTRDFARGRLKEPAQAAAALEMARRYLRGDNAAGKGTSV